MPPRRKKARRRRKIWEPLFMRPTKFSFWSDTHTSSPNFFRGVSDQNENQVGRKWKSGRKIFRAPPARKKRDSQIFRLRRAFFVVEALKTVKKPLKRWKTVNFSNFFPKTVKFLKKRDPKNFSPAAGIYFFNIGQTIERNWSEKRGGVKNTFAAQYLRSFIKINRISISSFRNLSTNNAD